MTRRFRYNAKHVGRVRVRLAAMIRALGWRCEPTDLWPQSGAWRTDYRLDVCRWEASISHPDGHSAYIQCWDTMTDCVARGIEIARHERFGWQIQAKSPAARDAAETE